MDAFILPKMNTHLIFSAADVIPDRSAAEVLVANLPAEFFRV